MKKLLLTSVLILGLPHFAYAQNNFVKLLMHQEANLNDLCHSPFEPYSDINTKACNLQDDLVNKIKTEGWCQNTKETSSDQKTWIKCELNNITKKNIDLMQSKATIDTIMLMREEEKLRDICHHAYPDVISPEQACEKIGEISKKLQKENICRGPDDLPAKYRDWAYCPKSLQENERKMGIIPMRRLHEWKLERQDSLYPELQINYTNLLTSIRPSFFIIYIIENHQTKKRHLLIKMILHGAKGVSNISLNINDYSITLPQMEKSDNTTTIFPSIESYTFEYELPDNQVSTFLDNISTAPYLKLDADGQTYKLSLLGSNQFMKDFTEHAFTKNNKGKLYFTTSPAKP